MYDLDLNLDATCDLKFPSQAFVSAALVRGTETKIIKDAYSNCTP